jgi:hypothetical protein
MTKEEDYRKNASDTLQLVQRVSSNEDKTRLLKLAEGWLDLADRAANAVRRPHRPTVVHPLLRDKIGTSRDRGCFFSWTPHADENHDRGRGSNTELARKARCGGPLATANTIFFLNLLVAAASTARARGFA